ncbi:MAG: hypothetical protein HGA61_04895 [Candidatus Moranbacteria bacterium]|nr:hypothetical protein [Candidatus Moranbacteria bacterium]
MNSFEKPNNQFFSAGKKVIKNLLVTGQLLTPASMPNAEAAEMEKPKAQIETIVQENSQETLSRDWVKELADTPILERIETLRKEVPTDRYESGFIAIKEDSGEYSFQDFQTSGINRLTLSYSGIRKKINSSESIYVVHTHPFTPEEGSFGRHLGDHIEISPSMLDLFVTIRDTAWFPEQYEKIKYVVVDDAGLAWKFNIKERENDFIQKALVFLSSGKIEEAVQLSNGEENKYFMDKMGATLSAEDKKQFELLLKASKDCQLLAGEKRDQAVQNLISSAASLGINIEVSLPPGKEKVSKGMFVKKEASEINGIMKN